MIYKDIDEMKAKADEGFQERSFPRKEFDDVDSMEQFI